MFTSLQKVEKTLHQPTQNEETFEKAEAIKMALEYQSSLRMAKMSKNFYKKGTSEG